MSEGNSASDVKQGKSDRDWLIALVVFLICWGMCMGASVLMLSMNGKYGKLPAWVGIDVKALACHDTRKTLIAESDIFAEQSFSYTKEDKEVPAQHEDSVEAHPADAPEDEEQAEGYFGEELRKIFVCGRSRGNSTDLHQSGNLFCVEADEPIVRSGDILYDTYSGKRSFRPALYKLLAYQEYRTLQENAQWDSKRFFFIALLSALVLLFFGYSLYFLRENFYDAATKQWLVLLLVAIHIGLLLLSHFIFRLFDYWPGFFLLMIFPSTLVPTLMSNMLGRRTGICGAMCLSILSTMLLGGPYQFQFFIHSLICSLVTIVSFQDVHNRMRFLLGGIYLALVSFALAILFTKYNNLAWAFQAPYNLFWLTLPSLIFINALVVILGMLLIPPICELVFDVTTVFTLNELNNRDHPLLERLLKQAPGTYEHSLAVARLASDAARAIGANVRLTETCAYFHDIGKLCDPKKFAENLMEDEENPHDKMSPEESANVLRQHVTYGMELAKKAHLPHAVKEAIAQHHGTGIMAFFAEQALREAQLANEPAPDMKKFTYPGPLPARIEVVLVSIADVCEAAVRASARKWSKVTSPLIREKVTALVMAKFQGGQFDNAKMVISDLHKVIDSIVESLCVVYHVRPEYPENAPVVEPQPDNASKGEQPQ